MDRTLCDIFGQPQRFESEIYVGDYTEYAKSHPDSPHYGVEMSNMPLTGIDSLHFVNPNHIPVLGVNFEQHQEAFDVEGGKRASNCECMLVSDKAVARGWLVLAELKYCSGANKAVRRNLKKAISQLESTFLHLRDRLGCLNMDNFRLYWIVSMPEHDNLIPFSAFLSAPEDVLEYKEKYGVNLLTDNIIRVLSHERITVGTM